MKTTTLFLSLMLVALTITASILAIKITLLSGFTLIVVMALLLIVVTGEDNGSLKR